MGVADFRTRSEAILLFTVSVCFRGAVSVFVVVVVFVSASLAVAPLHDHTSLRRPQVLPSSCLFFSARNSSVLVGRYPVVFSN